MNENSFIQLLVNRINDNISNYYKDNYDFLRFGPEPKNGLVNIFKRSIHEFFSSKLLTIGYFKVIFNHALKLLIKYHDRLESVHNLLDDERSKNTYLDLITFKILQYKKVKLQTNNDDYWNKLSEIEKICEKDNFIVLNSDLRRLYFFDLNLIKIPVKIYLRPSSLLHEFINQQYCYRDIVKPNEGDVVIDAGACWGDTALFFASMVGEKGKVYSFEFIPSNIEIFNKNINLNPKYKPIIQLQNSPLWDTSDIELFYQDKGPGSKVGFEKTNNYDGKCNTITIDKFIEENNIKCVDFIKMDIEGAELKALEGARKTIQKYKPILAISVYHSFDDFVNIPLWINELGIGYKLYLDHYTIHWEETVIYAILM